MSNRFNAFKKNERNPKQNKRWNNFKKNSNKDDSCETLKQNNRWTTFEKNTNNEEENNRFSDGGNKFGKNNEGGRFHRHGNKFHKRQKRIYKSRHTKEEFFNKMETRGSRQMGISLFDNIAAQAKKTVKNTANKTENKDMKVEEKVNTKKLNANKSGFENEKMSDNMKQFILNQCYEKDSEEEEEEGEFAEINDKKDETIGFL
jgi:hypothetical protein